MATKKLDPAWVGAAFHRHSVEGESIRAIAAGPDCPVSHQRLAAIFKRIAADAEIKRLEAAAQARAEKAKAPRQPGEPYPVPGPAMTAKPPLEPPPGAPEGALITPPHSATIGGWYAVEGPEIRGSKLLPGASLVASREVWSDDQPNRDITDRVAARAVQVAEQKRAEAERLEKLKTG
jgi:hypothetical protein